MQWIDPDWAQVRAAIGLPDAGGRLTGKTTLSDVDMEAGEGEVFWLVGPAAVARRLDEPTNHLDLRHQ